MVLNFGIHKGKRLEEVPEDYLKWLGKPVYSGKFYKELHSMEKEWKVPFSIMAEARKVLDAMGYELKGTRWEPK